MKRFLFALLALLVFALPAEAGFNIRQNADGSMCFVDSAGVCQWTITSDGSLVDSPSPSQQVIFVDEFLAAAIDGRISSTAGSGTGNAAATTVANGLNGTITVTSASDDGTHAANCSNLTLDQLNFRADQGGMAMEVRGSIDDVSEAAIFIGFTDTISTTVELPIYMNAAAIDSDAADAAGVVYDIDATTDEWTQGGVDTNTDTAPLAFGSAPADTTTFTVKVEVSAAGAVLGYIDGVAFTSATGSAITPTVAVTPAVVICNRSANQVILTLDYIWAKQDR